MRQLAVLLMIVSAVSLTPRAADEQSAAPVAVVCLLSGSASAKSELGTKKELRLFDLLPPRTAIEVAAGSRLVLTFQSGRRFELVGKSSGRIGLSDLEAAAGDVKALDSVSTSVALPSLARLNGEPSHALAVPIRTGTSDEEGTVADLYPAYGAAVLTDTAVLRFTSLGESVKYRIEIENEMGELVFAAWTSAPILRVSPGVLKAGASYFWRVIATLPGKSAVRGQASFVTLAKDNADAREHLRQQAERSNDAALMLLLAAVDNWFGLHREVCLDIDGAARAGCNEATVQQARVRFGCGMVQTQR